MKKIILLILLFLFLMKGFAQGPSLRHDYYEAEKLFTTAAALFKGQNVVYTLKGTGKEYVEGHFDAPFKLDTGSLEVTFSAGQAQQYHSSFGMDYRGVKYTSKYFFHNDSCDFLDYGDTLTLKQNAKKHALVYYYSPYNLILSIEKNKSTIHLISTNDRLYNILGFNDQYGNKFYAYFDKASKVVTRLLKPAYDEVMGDYYEEILYERYKHFEGIYFPSKIVHKRGHTAYREIFVTDLQSKPASKYLEEAALEISMDTISANLFLLKLQTLNNKILISRNSNYLSVFEAPASLSVCRQVIDFLKDRFPAYPIKYCFLSHHHPDHAGGATAFMELGSIVVTTQKNIPYFMTLFRSKHTMKPGQKNNRMPAKPSMEAIVSNAFKKYGERQCPVEVYESGNTTHHTKEYLFFYFPAEKVLFAADLVFFYQNNTYSQNERAFSVYKLIIDKKLSVDRIYTSWPLHGFKDYGTLEELRACLKAKYPNL